MRWVNLSQTSAPAAEPVSTADLKAFLNYEDDDQDSLIAALGASARSYCETYTRRAFITQSWEGFFYKLPESGEVWLPKPFIQSVEAVKYYDADEARQTLATSAYHVVTGENGLVKITEAPGVHASRPNRYEIEYTNGWGAAGTDCPEQILTAIKMLTVFWFDHRIGDTRGNTFIGKDSEVPLPIRVLLDPYRVAVERI